MVPRHAALNHPPPPPLSSLPLPTPTSSDLLGRLVDLSSGGLDPKIADVATGAASEATGTFLGTTLNANADAEALCFELCQVFKADAIQVRTEHQTRRTPNLTLSRPGLPPRL